MHAYLYVIDIRTRSESTLDYYGFWSVNSLTPVLLNIVLDVMPFPVLVCAPNYFVYRGQHTLLWLKEQINKERESNIQPCVRTPHRLSLFPIAQLQWGTWREAWRNWPACMHFIYGKKSPGNRKTRLQQQQSGNRSKCSSFCNICALFFSCQSYTK